MSAALDELAEDPDCWVVVITGSGDKAFSAGMDLKAFSSGEGGDIMGASGGFGGITQRDFPKPIIAAVNGSALAGGFEIMLSCDLVVAAEHATFGIPEAKRGLIAGAGGLIRMPKRLPMAVALELAMTGDPIDAERAYALGLVNRVVPADALLDEAMALAERIAANAPLAVRYSKSVMKRPPRCPRRRAGRSTTRRSASCSPRPTPWRARSPSPRSARPAGRASSAVLAPALDTIRLTLHVLAAAVWVGGQIVMTGLVGPARGLGGDAPKTLARAFARLAWPAYAVLVVTGFWNVSAVHYSEQDTAWKAVLMAKIAGGGPGRGGRLLHQRATTKGQLAVWGSVGGTASVAALVMGILLAG